MTSGMTYSVQLYHDERSDYVERIREVLAEYNRDFLPDEDPVPIVIPILDGSGNVVGGLNGSTADDWLIIDRLVVPAKLRRAGWGRKLVALAEEEAVRRACHSAWLGTFDFQARGFYEKLGYKCFGELNDRPKGHTMYFMKKTLKTVER